MILVGDFGLWSWKLLPSIRIVDGYSTRGQHQLISKDGTPDTMVSCALWMKPLLAPPMTDAQTLGQQPVTGANVASRLSTSEPWVSTFNQALISEETGTTIFIRQIWPDNIIKHVIFHRG